MATVRPFKGFRPLPQYAAQVAANPYDVLSSEEARIEAQGKPLSFLHVGKPEIDLPRGTDLYDPAVYEKGKENLQKLIRDGILKEDPHPYFYVYAQTMGTHTQYGIIGCASVQEYLNDTIKKHELTRKDKEDDRTRHVKVTNAHTGPIFLTYHAEPRIDEIVDRVRLADPVYNFVADDGIRHQLWVISDEKTIRHLVEHFGRVNNLYVADGHHRSAAAARVGKEIADANPNHKGDEEYNFFLAVLFPHNQLRIMEYNRVVKDLNGLNEEAFLDEIKKHKFTVQKSGQAEPKAKGEYGMYLNGHWYTLKADLSYLTNPDPVEKLDVSILQKNILAPILGIDDPRTNKRIDFVGGIRGTKELERRVNSGEMAVAFALYPTSIEELLTIADAGKIMPPKSTWFEPKLRDGVVVHFLS
ncbi:MAG: DUF1015 domain-containing protein [Bacteroidetes bacterium]|nr:DUF1015 domain-containing protein [Bacteroidota bacterium]MCW5894224.1 DUF1015 domain-containing protein [Bacteroidota bacterium]